MLSFFKATKPRTFCYNSYKVQQFDYDGYKVQHYTFLQLCTQQINAKLNKMQTETKNLAIINIPIVYRTTSWHYYSSVCQWHILSPHPLSPSVMSKYHKMHPNEYPNIFGCRIVYRTNIRQYLDATLYTERISEYIRMPHIYRMKIRIYSDAGNSTNTNTNVIRGQYYSNIHIHHWLKKIF